jgi:hypothetical protein
MPNRKKSLSERKKPMSFSIKTSIAEEFVELCITNSLIASNEVEAMIQSRINVLNSRYKSQ